jgi:transcriptional regulator with XRE-family HTH domain
MFSRSTTSLVCASPPPNPELLINHTVLRQSWDWPTTAIDLDDGVNTPRPATLVEIDYVGRLVAALCAGKSQRKFAENVGISQSTISKIIGGDVHPGREFTTNILRSAGATALRIGLFKSNERIAVDGCVADMVIVDPERHPGALGECFKSLREKAGLTQRDLGTHGLSRSSVQAFEAGKTVSLAVVPRYFKVFGFSAAYCGLHPVG